MTRIFTDGAEMQDNIFFYSWDRGGVSIGSSTPFASPYYYALPDSAYADKYISPISECYFRTRFRVVSTRGTDLRMPSFSYGGTEVAYVGSNGTNFIAATASGTTTTSVVITYNRWFLLESYLKIADSGGRFVLKIDGNIQVDFTGDTLPGATSTINRIFIRASGGDTTHFDDLALNDTDNSDGKNDNSWCGDGVIIRLSPSGSSATANDWLNSGSVSGSANYLYVDEYPNDGDTTYVYASASSTGLQTQFSLSDFSLTGANITRVWAEGRARKTSGNPYGVKIGQLASGGTDVMSGSQVLFVGAYSRIYTEEFVKNPVTSASWTQADVNGLELVLEIP